MYTVSDHGTQGQSLETQPGIDFSRAGNHRGITRSSGSQGELLQSPSPSIFPFLSLLPLLQFAHSSPNSQLCPLSFSLSTASSKKPYQNLCPGGEDPLLCTSILCGLCSTFTPSPHVMTLGLRWGPISCEFFVCVWRGGVFLLLGDHHSH